jgi:hypothetical protein
MKDWRWHVFFRVVLIAFVGIGLMAGCETGEKVVDEVTGNRAVKQYRKTEKDLEKLETQQAERYKSILGEEEEKDSDQ